MYIFVKQLHVISLSSQPNLSVSLSFENLGFDNPLQLSEAEIPTQDQCQFFSLVLKVARDLQGHRLETCSGWVFV
jgi:hypothetical protein